MVDVVQAQERPPVVPLLTNAIAIASGKGGVGKTWLSITLCHALARLGQKTLLFDGDLGLANVDIQLGLAPRHDLAAVVAGRCSLDDAVIDYREGGFAVIAGRSGSGGLAGLPADRVGALAKALAETSFHYDFVVLDLGAGIERTVRQLAALARRCLIVATDEPTAITDAYALTKLMLTQERHGDVRFAINMAASATDGERTYATLRKACTSFLKVAPQLAGVIRRDGKVKEAIRHQAPLLMRFPNCHAAIDAEAMARGLLERP